MIFPACILQIDSNVHQDLFTDEHIVEFILLVLAAVVAARIDWILTLLKKLFFYLNRVYKKEAKSLWKYEVKSNNIKPGVHFNITNFKEVFYERDSFVIAKEKFSINSKNIILIGRSGIGKTRSAYEILTKSKIKYDILMPFLTRPDNFDFSRSFKKRNRTILFIDDLNKYNMVDINYYLENLISNSTTVQLLCTCRAEYEDSIYYSYLIPDIERYILSEWTENEGKALASMLNVPFNNIVFDHTAASLLYRLEKLKEQYIQLNKMQKTILESIKLLKTFALMCDSGSIKEVAKNVFDLEKECLDYNTWQKEIRRLQTMGFYDINQDGEIVINDIYLAQLIELGVLSAFKRYFLFLKEIGNSGALFYCGVYFENNRNLILAEKCYNEAIAIYPQYASAHYRRGSLYLKIADEEADILDLNKARVSITTSINCFLLSIKIKAHDYSYYHTLAYAYTKAASIYNKLEEKEKEYNNLEQAIINYNIVLNLNPKSPGAFRSRGFCQFKMKRYNDAKNDYKTAAKYAPNSHHTYYMLGMLYADINEQEEALYNFNKCITLKKEFYQAYNDMGHVMKKKYKNMDSGNPEKKSIASATIKNYLLSIWYSRGKHYVAYLNLGHIYIELYEYRKAIKAISHVIKKSRNYCEAYASRAYVYTRIHEYTLAEKDLLKALRIKPKSENILHSLGFCYQQMGQEMTKNGNNTDATLIFEKALQCYDEMISLNEEQRTAGQIGKAITYEKMGNTKDASKILNNLFSNNSTNTKILSIMIRYFGNTNNDEQILHLLTILLNSIKHSEIKNIGKQLLGECTAQIQRLANNKMLSNNILELLQLLKTSYPNNYYVYKANGVYNLKRGIAEGNFNTKMNILKEAEEDFIKGKTVAPKNPVFSKYIAVANAKMCDSIKEMYFKTTDDKYRKVYKQSVEQTKKMFEEYTNIYPQYAELKIEHSIFLYTNFFTAEGEKVESEARLLLSDQLKTGFKTELQMIEAVKELDEIKSRLNSKVLN